MIQRSALYIFLFFLLIFTACKKDTLPGQNDYKTLGTSAKDLLTSSTFSALKIEINYMPGYQPDQLSLDKLKTFLEKYLNKPGGIDIHSQEIRASGKTVLTLKEIVSLEKKYRGVFTESNDVGVHILITDTDYSVPDNYATSYWNTSFCIFGKTMADNSGQPGKVTRSTLLTTLLQHEFGHLMGLVGQGSPMPLDHRDAEFGAHCNNSSCLMFHEVETPTGDNLTVPALDANCRADLKANGGK